LRCMRGIALSGKVRFLDTTLRDGEQTHGVSLSSEEKLMIAKNLDALGVQVIEAGSAITSEGERKSIKDIANAGLKAEICSYVRALASDVDVALACDVDSIHLVVPVSDLHIACKMKSDRQTALTKAVEITEYAKDHGLIVELSGEDASRADQDFLTRLYRAGVEAGADRLCYCDTVGVLVPETAFNTFSKLSTLGAPVSVHCHNDFGMATANTVAALRGGASQAHVTVNGIGERSGNASLEEVVMTLEALYNINTGIRCHDLYQLSSIVSRLTGLPLAPNKAIVGDNAFTHESGIHVHDLLKDTATYEPMHPETVGRKRRFVLGKHAGRASVELTLSELGISVNDNQLSQIVPRIKELCDKGKRVSDADLVSIANTVLSVKKEQRVKLLEMVAVAGISGISTASVRLQVNGQEMKESGTGVGPVDAAINAVIKAVQCEADVRLKEYKVNAVTGGTDALVEVWVTLTLGDKEKAARGAGADIVRASVEAFIDGINGLMQLEEIPNCSWHSS
jgi:(R)-citramalate synthase